MSLIKSKLIFFIYYSTFFFLLFEILFSEKNIFTFFNNFDLIYEYENNLKNKKKEFETLNNFLNNFEGSDEFKKIVIKDKLFYKDKNEKVYLSPHTAAFTEECMTRMGKETIQNIIDFFNEKLEKSKIVKL